MFRVHLISNRAVNRSVLNHATCSSSISSTSVTRNNLSFIWLRSTFVYMPFHCKSCERRSTATPGYFAGPFQVKKVENANFCWRPSIVLAAYPRREKQWGFLPSSTFPSPLLCIFRRNWNSCSIFPTSDWLLVYHVKRRLQAVINLLSQCWAPNFDLSVETWCFQRRYTSLETWDSFLQACIMMILIK